ncbi:helix-turn-helix transcriptional regulator [Streptosporangium sp. NPDC002721]|uniref:helix-turn-helix transcriptional regulator n=1 Tax=Streptosporangium sp. NPDC002721 TaxID=3366188 RepID=UPI0036D0BCA4
MTPRRNCESSSAPRKASVSPGLARRSAVGSSARGAAEVAEQVVGDRGGGGSTGTATDTATEVEVEPYRLVSWRRRWFLVAYDLGAHAWRALPVADLTGVRSASRRFAPRSLPDDDLVAFVLREVARTGWKVHARVTVLAPAETVIARINPAVGVVEAVDSRTSVLVTGADALETVAVYLSMLMMDFRVDGPPELVAHIRTLARRYAEALDG